MLPTGSSLEPRNVTVNGRRTSLRLEPAMWHTLHEICEKEDMELKDLLSMIDGDRSRAGLTSAIRSFVASYLSRMLETNAKVRSSIVVRDRGTPVSVQTIIARMD